MANRDSRDRAGGADGATDTSAARRRFNPGRGLRARPIPGGEDPNPGPAKREERFWGGLVVLMVAIIVLGGFLLTILGIVLGSGGPH